MQVQFKVNGKAKVDVVSGGLGSVTAAGILDIKGAMVKINS